MPSNTVTFPRTSVDWNSICMFAGMIAAASCAMLRTARRSFSFSSGVAWASYRPSRSGKPKTCANCTHDLMPKFLKR